MTVILVFMYRSNTKFPFFKFFSWFPSRPFWPKILWFDDPGIFHVTISMAINHIDFLYWIRSRLCSYSPLSYISSCNRIFLVVILGLNLGWIWSVRSIIAGDDFFSERWTIAWPCAVLRPMLLRVWVVVQHSGRNASSTMVDHYRWWWHLYTGPFINLVQNVEFHFF